MEIELAASSCGIELPQRFSVEGAIAIDNFLARYSAEALLKEMQESRNWLEIFTAAGKTYEMRAADFEALPDEQRLKIADLSHDAALQELQYRYRSIRVSEDRDERASRGYSVDKFADLMNSPAGLKLLRQATGMNEIDFVDAQATAYRAGNFLTNHDDDVDGKNRLAAYVFSLTPEWSLDWGGLLLLEDDNAVHGYVPTFNSLRVFKVPQNHCVSIVAPWVKATRYSITGWLRQASR